MKTTLVVLAGVVLMSQTAFAKGGNLVPGKAFLPTVRSQIYSEAKQVGAFKNLQKPELRIQNGKHGTVSAQIYSLGIEGPIYQGQKQTEILQEMATFKIKQVVEGQIAVPVKSGGQVWHQVYRAF